MFAFIGKAYDAVVGNGRRRQKVIDLRTEDKLLLPIDRAKLISDGRNMRRNLAIVAWAIRKHLDYVSTFTFQCSGNCNGKLTTEAATALNKRVEDLITWYSRPLNCDVSGRFSLQRMIRLLEGSATVDGDSFLYKMSDGRVQLIEGDRIKMPADVGDFFGNIEPNDFTHGVQVTKTGKPLRYAICERTGAANGFRLTDVAQAKYIYAHGYFDRYDQVRGISPLSAAMNQFFDLYEAQEYALAKMKLAQLLGLKFMHKTPDPDSDGKPYSFDFGSGPQVMDLDPGDDAEFLESKTPSTEFQAFMQMGIAIALKALDIPLSFFDESHTNYSGARQALLQYEQSCDSKRANLQQILTNLTIWRLQLFILDGELVLPDGVTLDDLLLEWIPAGLPWIDPLKEVTANTLAVKGGFRSRQMICKESGTDFFKVADQIAEENAYLSSKGLSPDIENITLQAVGELLNAGNDKAAA